MIKRSGEIDRADNWCGWLIVHFITVARDFTTYHSSLPIVVSVYPGLLIFENGCSAYVLTDFLTFSVNLSI